MLKFTEIEVNNFFNIYYKEETKVVQVIEIDGENVLVQDSDFNKMLVPFEDLKPIQITKQLMYNLGFIEYSAIKLLRNDTNTYEQLCVYKKDWILSYVVICDDIHNQIENDKPHNFIWNSYFHQLQNFLRKVYEIEVNDRFVLVTN